MIIVGTGGHAVSVLDALVSNQMPIEGFVDESGTTRRFFGYTVEKDIGALINPDARNDCCIAIGDNHTRELVHERLSKLYPMLHFPPVIHKTAYVSTIDTTVAEGSVVLSRAFIGPGCKVHKFCIMNTSSSIDHESIMNDFSSLAPGAKTGGKVTIGRRSAICIGASIKHGASVGADIVIGAHSYLHHNVEQPGVYYGVPAIYRRAFPTNYL